MLLYPKSALVIANTVAAGRWGRWRSCRRSAPLTLLVWGSKRVCRCGSPSSRSPRRLHDPSLNPIRARVSLGLRVLSYNDLSLTHPGYYLFLAHQVVKEAMAAIGSVGNVAAVLVGDGDP